MSEPGFTYVYKNYPGNKLMMKNIDSFYRPT
jgi:hypothetical protein